MSKSFIHKNCELYVGRSPYKEDMTNLPLECFLTEEEYEKLSDQEKKNYCLLIDGKVECLL
jgi:hypothetical protein